MGKERITLDDRINIQSSLAKHKTMKELCRIIKKNQSTIYRELKKYSYVKESDRKGCFHCSKLSECRADGVFVNRTVRYKCIDFEPIPCNRLKKYPFVCNGCDLVQACHKHKIYYDCKKAEYISRLDRVGTRKKKRIPFKIISRIDEIVSPLVKRGQSLHHIYTTNQELKKYCSERTIRRLIYDRFLEAKASSLPRYLSYRHSVSEYDPSRNQIHNIDRMLERTFTDFQRYTKNHPDLSVVQYDSVVGKKHDKKAILTITFPNERFQFGRLIRKGDARYVLDVMDSLFTILGDTLAKEVFAINLSDNGTEFASFHHLETRNVRVYFTNPYRSIDKAACERNHEFIRYIIPKNKTMDKLTQEKVDLMFSHINSYVRKSNQNKTPYELILERFGKDFLDLIGIKKISPQDILLTPELLL